MQQFAKYSHTIERLHEGSLSEYIGLSASLLKQQGYSRALAQLRILLINRFSRDGSNAMASGPTRSMRARCSDSCEITSEREQSALVTQRHWHDS
jgi:hypothetical protein